MTGRTEGISNPLKYLAVRLGERQFACDLNHLQEVQLNPHTGASSIDSDCIVLILETSKGMVDLHESTYYLINLEHIASSWQERKDLARPGISVSAGDIKI